jgi:hypothetical protein
VLKTLNASIAEVGLSIATTLGGDGATLVRDAKLVPFERTDALPVRVVDGIGHFIVVDSDGGAHGTIRSRVLVEANLRFIRAWEMDRERKEVRRPLL